MGNNTSTDTLFKSRSYSASIKAGYSLYTNNFRKIFKASWLQAIVFAIIFSALGTTCAVHLPRLLLLLLANADNPNFVLTTDLTLISIIATLVVFGAVAEILFYACGMSLFKLHSTQDTIPYPTRWFSFDKSMSWRTLKAAFFCILIPLVPAIAFFLFFIFRLRFMLAEPGAHIATLSITAIVSFIVSILLLPLCYVAFRYILNDETHFWKSLAGSYRIGIRHLGSIFATSLVCIIVILIAGIIILLPANIIMIANLQSSFGVAAYSDPAGMPESIVVITAIAFFFAGLLEAFIRMSAMFPLYYVYGSIETQEEERRKFKETQFAETQNDKNQTISLK